MYVPNPDALKASSRTHAILAVPFQNQHLIEQNELLRKRSSILEEENASLSCQRPLTSKPKVATAAVDGENMNLAEPAPNVDEHWYQPPPAPMHSTPSPPIPPSSLEVSVAVSCEEKGEAAGLTKSAALGCVSLQQKPLALLRSLHLSSWTASMKVNLLAKVMMLMT